MKLGILITTDRHAADVVGLTKAAVSKGHEVIIFNMDAGTKLLGNASFTELCKTKGVTMAFCDHSAGKEGVSKEGIPAEMVCGSQFNNANMMHDADRVINL
ncbi:MAG: DsrE family protein [Thermodesulfovibrionales bacterium]|nr:DsrE family protein [Thermodesulfovibrionales bacterium]